MSPHANNPKPPPVVTMFLKPSFSVTAQSSGMLVAVTAQAPVVRN